MKVQSAEGCAVRTRAVLQRELRITILFTLSAVVSRRVPWLLGMRMANVKNPRANSAAKLRRTAFAAAAAAATTQQGNNLLLHRHEPARVLCLYDFM